MEKRLAAARSPKRKELLEDIIRSYQKHLQFFNGLLPDETYERWSARYPASGELLDIKVSR